MAEPVAAASRRTQLSSITVNRSRGNCVARFGRMGTPRACWSSGRPRRGLCYSRCARFRNAALPAAGKLEVTPMSIDQAELGRRLKEARESCGLTQDDTAREMGVSRATIAQIELGNRSVSGLELAKLSYLYARDIREFLAPNFSADGLTAVLLRAEDGAGDGVKAALRDCIALGHQLRDLETLLGISRSAGSVASYPSVSLGSKWDSIQSGTQTALEERRRLGLGSGPLGDLP